MQTADSYKTILPFITMNGSALGKNNDNGDNNNTSKSNAQNDEDNDNHDKDIGSSLLFV